MDTRSRVSWSAESTGPPDGPAVPLSLDPTDLDMLLLIRHVELGLLKLFAAGHLGGTTHTCLGQEYVPVALNPLLQPAFVFSNHRGHGHYLAQFGDVAGLIAEVTGREGAVCGGRGGSQHLYRTGFCSTGVQGENVPVALGAALHFRTSGSDSLAVAYIGDGTWGEGVVYEALNMARLWRAPLVVVVENNGIAQTTPTSRAMAGSIAARAAAFDVRYAHVAVNCVRTIRAELAEPLRQTRAGAGPLVIEFRTDRLGPHSKGDDTRDPAVVRELWERDWAAGYARAYPTEFASADERQREFVAAVTAEVLARPLVGSAAG
ncbi:thiamine pyrophosphate-dependent dehydrogenase E1 component subunit alpha [Plantactinospora sp. S1510]|uniref:Thiamine pyrophosphate-dependent dehydrogenase E1 component subunit alpha n=1 Tax=Plantactinospora alkalitolerans TaxID=2789879 RepID=A0ABS0H2W6_9ACTN|nr:thiamine pyrophosphate-dependent dehydrogenase E1 component subunit alpha [Plantactinospora alkalitolerans]MBF9132805.1 thiamine pyrophosphate-dependent dehydrogenase E1 component subunit alpha [Plantactinospora alkalitolerans]